MVITHDEHDVGTLRVYRRQSLSQEQKNRENQKAFLEHDARVCGINPLTRSFFHKMVQRRRPPPLNYGETGKDKLELKGRRKLLKAFSDLISTEKY
jgi:hypothetical protein